MYRKFLSIIWYMICIYRGRDSVYRNTDACIRQGRSLLASGRHHLSWQPSPLRPRHPTFARQARDISLLRRDTCGSNTRSSKTSKFRMCCETVCSCTWQPTKVVTSSARMLRLLMLLSVRHISCAATKLFFNNPAYCSYCCC